MQAELEEEKALQFLRSHDPPPMPQVITVKSEDDIDPNKLVLPILNAKSEPELEQWLVRARTGLQSAARDSGLSFFAKAEAVGKMYVEDWRDSAAHQRGGILLRDPGYTQKEREVEKKIGASIIAKLPVAAQDFAQKDAESKGGVLELHVALSKAFLLIMATTADEKDAIVDKLREKQNVPAGKLLQFMKQYRLDYERLVNCGFIREADDHNKYYKALQHAAMNPGRSPSFVTAEVMYKRDNPPPTFFMSKKYFDGYLEFLTKELYGHQEYGESHGNFDGGDDQMFGATCTHPTCENTHGHTIEQCPTRRREQSERDKAFAAAAKATATEGTADNTKKRSFACRMLVNGSTCRYGAKCMFSHDPEVVNAFKNMICPWGTGCSFHTSGTGCSYGIHDEKRVHFSAASNTGSGPAGGLSLDVLAKSSNDPDYMLEDGADDAWYL